MKGVYTRDSIEATLSTWLAAGKDATVCVHSQSGYRAGKTKVDVVIGNI